MSISDEGQYHRSKQLYIVTVSPQWWQGLSVSQTGMDRTSHAHYSDEGQYPCSMQL